MPFYPEGHSATGNNTPAGDLLERILIADYGARRKPQKTTPYAGIAGNLRRAFARQENSESCVPPARRNAAVESSPPSFGMPALCRATSDLCGIGSAKIVLRP
jgi:hypothetical protein